MIDIPELYAACIIEYVRSLDSGVFTGPEYLLIKEARDRFDLYYHEQTFRLACKILENEKVIERYSHPGMMAYYRVEASVFNDRFGKMTGSGSVRHYQLMKDFGDNSEYKVLESYHDLGSEWLLDAISTYDGEVTSHLESLWTEGTETGEIPASDRIVSRNDNSEVIIEIEETLQNISAEFESSNEVGNALGDMRDIAVAEIDDLKAVLGQPAFRVSNFLNRAKGTLHWLAKKCAETTVSEMIKHVLNLIINWLV